MKEPELTMRADRPAWSMDGEIGIHLMDRANMTVATEVVMQSPEPMTGRSPLTMLDERAAQRLMDDLWNCGIRPTEGAGTAGSMAATAAHLADMRAIAFSLLKIEKPKR